MTASEFELTVARELKLAYKRDDFLGSDEMMTFWYEKLRGFKTRTVRMVVDDYIKHNRFQPAIADIYDPCEEYERSCRGEMREIFLSAKGTYPCAMMEDGTMDAWNKLTAADDWSKRIDKARGVEIRIRRFVRQHELDGTINDIPTFTEYLQGIANEH